MDSLAVGITTTSDRQKELNACIASMRKWWLIWTIHIFAEPENGKKYKIKDKDVKLYINKEQLWCFKNFHKMLSTLLSLNKKYIWLWQDDFLYEEWAIDRLQEVLHSNIVFWYYAMHTRPRMEKYIYKNWWNAVDLWRFARWMNYVMRSDVARWMVKHPFYQNHLMTYTKNQQVDSCVSYVLQLMKLPMYYHNPSLSLHSWDSTIWHIDRYDWCMLHKEIEPTMIWIASIPNREKELEVCINSLYNQADKIVVWLNNYKSIPSFLKRPWIEVIMWDNSLWDAIKFAKIDWYKWYYFTCDDDLKYPKDYIKNMIASIEKYGRKAIIWTHWIVVPQQKIWSYYSSCYRYSYKLFLPTDNFVNILGTWTTWFHTDTIKLSIKDFKQPNMADIRLGLKAQKHKVPMCCIKHEKDCIGTMNTNWSIWEDKHNSDEDITKIVNSIVWNVFYLNQAV